MRRHTGLLCLLPSLIAGPVQADSPQQPDGRAQRAVSIVMGSAIGAANPPNCGHVLLALGLVPDDNDRDPVEICVIWTLTYLSAGTYDVVAGENGAGRRSAFAANLAILGSGYLLACHDLHDYCEKRSTQQLSRGFYVAPLRTERGALPGYHWSF